MVCSLGIQDAAKWQFWRKSQRPFKIWALAISSSALGPWPRPREIMSRCSVLPRSSLANLRSWVPGSEPVTIQQWHQVDYIGKELCTLYAPNQDTMIFLSGMIYTCNMYVCIHVPLPFMPLGDSGMGEMSDRIYSIVKAAWLWQKKIFCDNKQNSIMLSFAYWIRFMFLHILHI